MAGASLVSRIRELKDRLDSVKKPSRDSRTARANAIEAEISILRDLVEALEKQLNRSKTTETELREQVQKSEEANRALKSCIPKQLKSSKERQSSRNVVKIPNDEPSALKALIEFLYVGDYDIMTATDNDIVLDFHLQVYMIGKPAKRTRFLALRSEGMPTLLALRLAQQTNDKLLPRVEVDNGFAGPNNDAAPPK
ncbi:hypothetical protein HDK90DRAFT_545128 [Phyllosticta capitalensis]|uniref:BTB domain-containing protein n=1 Tax=Phyllosticta capitalensis TaxID=121624 RepID=A0ABR1Y8P2_9PEZI